MLKPPDALAVRFYKALWKRAGVILSNEQAAQEMTEAIEPDEDSDVMLATILAAEARAYFAEETIHHGLVASLEIADLSTEVERLRAGLTRIAKSQWEHRCADGIGGCTAVSAVALSNTEDLIGRSRNE